MRARPIIPYRVLLPITGAFGLLVNCGGGSRLGEDYQGVTREKPERILTVEDVVSHDRGGTLTLEDGTQVIFPAGSFETDTRVILTRETCTGVFASRHFDSCLYRVGAGSTSHETGVDRLGDVPA